MQASVRAASRIIARTGKKGLESAAALVPRARSCELQRQWRWSQPFSTVGVEECEVAQSLRDEVRRLKAANVVREVAPPEPFTLQETPGSLDVTLHRDFDHEKINVECGLLLHPSDEEEEEEEEDDPVKAPYALLINLTITVTKEDAPEALEVSCQCHGDEYFINYVSFHENLGTKGHDHAVHEKQLSKDLKREFVFYLFLRGFDDEMALFLHHYFERKRNQERITNFEKVAAVLDQ